ncbi:MAG: hypothetical protein HRU15_05760, partial [Planctomycetes bacterium]|nr:hypothetical protein [Planctomycetota bacterium]
LRAHCNTDFNGVTSDGVNGWTGDPENDLCNLPTGEQSFNDVNFDVITPANNQQRSCIGLNHSSGYSSDVEITVNNTAQSIYFLHAAQGGGLLGWFEVHYEDDSHVTQYVHSGSEINTWFMPAPNDPFAGGNEGSKQNNLRVAWQGSNASFENVGIHNYGWTNPHPEKNIRSIRCHAAETNGKWLLAGITLSDAPVYFPVSPVSYGIPDSWGAGAMMYALIEGLAGVVDTSSAFKTLRIAPRWAAADVKQAEVSVVYPASNGYAAYKYSCDDNSIQLDFTGNAEETVIELALPENFKVNEVLLNDEAVTAEERSKGGMNYLHVAAPGLGAQTLLIFH